MRDNAYMTSEAYVESTGRGVRRWPRAYNAVISKPCPRCHAKPLELCTNPERRTKKYGAKIPCLARIKQEWPEDTDAA
jgi:hypothetical protein